MTYKMLNVDQFYYLDNIKELRTSSVWLQHLCVFVDSDYYYYEFIIVINNKYLYSYLVI